ncbi:MAG: hypothetical protein U1A77_21025 [Pirellulales bacterium]
MSVSIFILLALHLLCVNLASVSPLVGVWLEWMDARGNAAARRLAPLLAWHGVISLVIGVCLGASMGWLLWNDRYREAVLQLGSRLHNGGAELVFSLALMIWHAWWCSRPNSPSRRGRWGRATLAMLAGTNLVYHFPVLMVILARLATGEDPTTDVLNSAAFRQRLIDPTVLARCVHFWLASVAVTGVWLLAISWRWQGRLADDQSEGPNRLAEAHHVARWGARLALIPTLLQIPSGIWLLSTVSPLAQSRLLGGDLTATLAFGGSVLMALGFMHRLAAIGMGETSRPQLAQAIGLLVAIVTLMTYVLRFLENSTSGLAT